MTTPTITEQTTSPRTRWAAIIWGLLFAAIAALALGQIADATRRETIADALLTLTPTTLVTIVLLSVGVLFLVGGTAGLIRRAQRKLAAATDAPQPEVQGPLGE